jgi:type VI secretion system protein ImpC
MAERFSRSSVHLDVTAGEKPAHEIPSSDTPFQLLVIGDFSGRANRGLHASLAGRRLYSVDCDNLDDTLAAMEVALDLPQTRLTFGELDDFHPDHIYRNAELFRKLEDLRDQRPSPPVPATRTAAAPGKPLDLQPGRSLLDQMVEENDEDETPAPTRSGDSLADFIGRAVAPHLVQSDPGKEQWSARVDAVATEQMRAVLHHEEFQAIEAAWRAVEMLVRRLNPDSELRIYLLDATLQELLDQPQQLVELLAAREPLALIAANFAFGQSAQDAGRLRTLGRIAAGAGAPILTESQPPSEAVPGPEWIALRQSADSRWIGLALPRFLLRLPYGNETSEVESFAFEEMPQSVHADYLWGNPAFACACLLGEAFRDDGWNLSPGRGQITGLPLHVYQADGESVCKPCAEILLSERDAEFLLENGLMPLASMKNRDSILLPRLQSIADPIAQLAGRWTGGR